MKTLQTIEDRHHDEAKDVRILCFSIKGDLPALKNRKGTLLEALVKQAVKPENFIELEPGKVYYCKPTYGIIGDYYDVATYLFRKILETEATVSLGTWLQIKAFQDSFSFVNESDFMEGRKKATAIISRAIKAKGASVRIPPVSVHYFNPMVMEFVYASDDKCFDICVTGRDYIRGDYNEIMVSGRQLCDGSDSDREIYEQFLNKGPVSI